MASQESIALLLMSLGHRVAPHLFSEPSQRAEPHEIYTIDDGNFAIFCQEVCISLKIYKIQFFQNHIFFKLVYLRCSKNAKNLLF